MWLLDTAMIAPFVILPLEVMNKPMSSAQHPKASDRFSNSADTLRNIAQDMLSYARKQGATASSVEVSEGFGQSVTVRHGEVETIEYNRDKGLGITVYLGQQRGNAGTSDFSPQAVRDTVDAALSIARYTAVDDCSGLPEEEALATDFPDMDLYHPWDLPVEEAIAKARVCEQTALDADERIQNSEGATVSVHEAQFVFANSLGFVGGYPSSRHSMSCSVIAEQDDAMERDYWYSVARAAGDLLSVQQVGRIAAERTVRRLGARQIPTMQAPVLFDSSVASSLMGHFVGAVSGGSLYRKSSFLLDQLDKSIFSSHVNISDIPDIPRGLASGAFDDEGVKTQRRNIVEDGVLRGYFLGSYSARKLGLHTTGNAGGNHNLIMKPSGGQDLSLAGMLRNMNCGLLVTELLGQGVNSITGDYSRGAAGFWVENGEIQYPVHEVTIAGNLKDMYRHIVAVGSDVLAQSSRQCGSILIEEMTIAGS
jgi:PmbA protein